ncbi:DHA1 family L-arabinose/isopropyl-beta-D-thiogalactopyranoside export protein-like MFS transporter [Volucribacter psittacicida]|uniref:Probable sugar efflux transporter n=1 Tax=Volucribacter psittacicida TaxID=203482 RepID=A0A4R1FMR2_9PAST|nr:sugar transporter [Volucribacter psittacicida]TCJ94684.1 DHA1 family L-arabinose/isopropyl-beta-D-thiogalactopyranoside export protein-like MFS transporter [Volucribacter psittacicida]
MLSKQQAQRIGYYRVIAFACAAFIFNTTEFIPVALLSDIAQGFAMPVSQTGLMITVYAWIVSLMSLPFMLVTAKLERRRLLIKIFLLFIAGHILTVFAWNFWILLLGRIGVALAHALFWAITASLVVRVAPKDKKTQALALLALGTALALVLGLPLGRIVGQLFGWRITFALIGAFALLIMLVMIRLLPSLPSKNVGSVSSIPVLFKRPLLVGLYLLTMIIVTAHFTAYSYIEPFVLNISQMSGTMATSLLLVFGLSGITASLIFNRCYRFSPNKFLLLLLGLLVVSLLLLLPLSHHSFAMFILIFLWGIGISGIGLSLQVRVLQLAPDATDVAMSIYSGIYNIGIGAGALVGNQVMQHLGLGQIGMVGGITASIGILLFLWVNWYYNK